MLINTNSINIMTCGNFSKPDVRDVVYCYGFRQQTGSDLEEDFAMILSLYGNETEERERGRLRDTLACTTDEATLQRYTVYILYIHCATWQMAPTSCYL